MSAEEIMVAGTGDIPGHRLAPCPNPGNIRKVVIIGFLQDMRSLSQQCYSAVMYITQMNGHGCVSIKFY